LAVSKRSKENSSAKIVIAVTVSMPRKQRSWAGAPTATDRRRTPLTAEASDAVDERAPPQVPTERYTGTATEGRRK